jgi:phospholipase/carboxylesterase
MNKITPTIFRKPASGGKAKQLVVILHGWGADGANLIDLADVFAQTLPDAHFVAPNAPFTCEANPFGFQWFSLMDRQSQHMLSGIRRATDLLNEFIDDQLALLEQSASGGVQGEGIKIALVGFSQGAMLALHLAMRRTPQISAVVGFSGALVAAEMLPLEICARPPVCLIHGEGDDVVPYPSMANAAEHLRANGVAVNTHSRPFLGHGIDMEGIITATEFLKGRLG